MLQNILDELEAEISNAKLQNPKMIPGDKWLKVSALQKAIRRSEVKRAMSAAFSLMHEDKQSFWRRLPIISLEDVGVVSHEIITKVLVACSATAWRKRVGEIETGLYLTSLLCGATKTRLADSVFVQAERAVRYKDLRLELSHSSDEALTGFLADDSKSLIEKAIAGWLLFGTKRFPSDLMPVRVGSFDKGVAALRALDVPRPLIEACVSVIKQSQWPLSVMAPLIMQEVQKHRLEVRNNIIPVTPDIDGLPYYSADMFTRTGKSCLRQLQRSIPALKTYSSRQIELGIFFIEGHLTDRTATSGELEAILHSGEITDIESAGLDPSGYALLRECLLDNMSALMAIRREQLTKYLKG